MAAGKPGWVEAFTARATALDAPVAVKACVEFTITRRPVLALATAGRIGADTGPAGTTTRFRLRPTRNPKPNPPLRKAAINHLFPLLRPRPGSPGGGFWSSDYALCSAKKVKPFKGGEGQVTGLPALPLHPPSNPLLRPERPAAGPTLRPNLTPHQGIGGRGKGLPALSPLTREKFDYVFCRAQDIIR